MEAWDLRIPGHSSLLSDQTVRFKNHYQIIMYETFVFEYHSRSQDEHIQFRQNSKICLNKLSIRAGSYLAKHGVLRTILSFKLTQFTNQSSESSGKKKTARKRMINASLRNIEYMLVQIVMIIIFNKSPCSYDTLCN